MAFETSLNHVYTMMKDKKMREIIFRGKAVNDGKWHEGSYISRLNKEYIVDVQFHDIEEIKIEKAMEEVQRDSLGQFTGMVDQYGTKVFEGDICEVALPCGNSKSMTVVWDNYFHLYRMKTREGELHLIFDTLRFKVIGTIHDDPGPLA